MKSIRLILFDIDGTLITTGGAGLRAFASVAHATFGCRDGTAHLQFSGRTDTSILREFFRDAGLPPTPANFQRFFDDYVFWLDQHLAERPGSVLPGVWDTLQSLQTLPKPPLVGLLTGNIRLGAELKLRHFGLWPHFALGVFGDDHEDRNELAVIGRDRGSAWLDCALKGEEILIIGDTPHDIACAKYIGARCLAVATGGATLETLRSRQPDWAVPSLSAVEVAGLCR